MPKKDYADVFRAEYWATDLSMGGADIAADFSCRDVTVQLDRRGRAAVRAARRHVIPVAEAVWEGKWDVGQGYSEGEVFNAGDYMPGQVVCFDRECVMPLKLPEVIAVPEDVERPVPEDCVPRIAATWVERHAGGRRAC